MQGMNSRVSGEGARVGGQPSLPPDLGESRHLLATLYKSSTVGVAVCDRQLRFRAINHALASMNGLPPREHIGKTIHTVLGEAAAKVQPAFEHVFTTGEPLCNYEVTAKLPKRAAPGYWNEHYFPLKNGGGVVEHVGAVVLELARRDELKDTLLELTNNLRLLGSSLRDLSQHPQPSLDKQKTSESGALRLLQGCLRNVRSLSDLLNSAPPYQILEPGSGRSRVRDFAAMVPVTDAKDFVNPLSAREMEVVALLASGKSNRDISSLLAISRRTVETHRAKIMLKLNVHSLSDLVRYALRNQLVQG
jgi:DNA-binding CsgD family transcriptional regulator